MGLKELKKKVEETKEKFDALQQAMKIMKILEESIPKMIEEQKRTNELLEKIFEKLGGEEFGDICKKE